MTSLENQFLIAMPTLEDGYFDKTVTYICEHNDEGAMGLIINSALDLTLIELLKKVDFSPVEKAVKSEKLSRVVTATVKSSPVAQDDKPTVKSSTTNVTFTQSRVISDNSLEQLVLSGGPLAQERGFVLHSTQKGWQSSLALSEHLMITTSKDILLALGTDKAPEKFMITLVYAGWGPGQLEEEIQANAWLTTPVDNNIIFNTPIEQRWQKAAAQLGIDLAHLSTDIGHA